MDNLEQNTQQTNYFNNNLNQEKYNNLIIYLCYLNKNILKLNKLKLIKIIFNLDRHFFYKNFVSFIDEIYLKSEFGVYPKDLEKTIDNLIANKQINTDFVNLIDIDPKIYFSSREIALISLYFDYNIEENVVETLTDKSNNKLWNKLQSNEEYIYKI